MSSTLVRRRYERDDPRPRAARPLQADRQREDLVQAVDVRQPTLALETTLAVAA